YYDVTRPREGIEARAGRRPRTWCATLDVSSALHGAGVLQIKGAQVRRETGGSGDTASGFSASVSGGSGNVASDVNASVSGGASTTASGPNASVRGGTLNLANADSASVSGGEMSSLYPMIKLPRPFAAASVAPAPETICTFTPLKTTVEVLSSKLVAFMSCGG